MKNKDIEKNIRKTLSPNQKKIWEKVKQKVGSQSSQTLVTVTEGGNGNAVMENNKRNILISLAVIFLVAIISVCCFIPKFIGNGKLNFSGSYFLDINPSIQVTVDNDGKVTDVIGVNQDALVLLQGANKENMIGKPSEEVAAEIWQVAFNAGYISATEKNNAVLVTGYLEDQNLNQEFSNKIKQRLTKHSKEKGVYCAVLTKGIDQTVIDMANELGITPSKYQLILDAKNLGVVIGEAEYQTVSIKEINQRVMQLGKKLEDFGGENYKEYEKIEEYVEEVKEQLLEGIEDALEYLEDRIENFPNAEYIEEEIEFLEEILEDIEDGTETGKNTDELFELLYANLSELSQLNQEIALYIQTLCTMVEDVQNRFAELIEQVETAKEQLKNKYNQMVEECQGNKNHQKPTNFDQDYEDWLEEVYEDYQENWEQHKYQWGLGHKG